MRAWSVRLEYNLWAYSLRNWNVYFYLKKKNMKMKMKQMMNKNLNLSQRPFLQTENNKIVYFIFSVYYSVEY